MQLISKEVARKAKEKIANALFVEAIQYLENENIVIPLTIKNKILNLEQQQQYKQQRKQQFTKQEYKQSHKERFGFDGKSGVTMDFLKFIDSITVLTA